VTDRFEGRFDHAVILVPDLADATAMYERLGFAVSAGGRHEGLGTHNAIIRFGLDYLELLAVRDDAEAGASSSASKIVEMLRDGKGGLASFALATAKIEADAARFARAGMPAVGPFAMKRMRPDAKLLSWRLLVPEGTAWRVPWPFLIQWDQDDATRLGWEKPGMHANGAERVAGVSIAVRDLAAAAELYESRLGLRCGPEDAVTEIEARRRVAHLGSFEISLCAPSGEGWLSRRLHDFGEGIYEVSLAARAGADRVIDAADALGARFALRAAHR
jgi:catechol 2,3-dioxygenase-like lactoylglutathione lyase family enzyme